MWKGVIVITGAYRPYTTNIKSWKKFYEKPANTLYRMSFDQSRKITLSTMVEMCEAENNNRK